MLLRDTIKFLAFVLLVATLIFGFAELGILLYRQGLSLNLASIDILKVSTSDPLKVPQECLSRKSDGYSTSWSCFEPYFERITKEISVNAAMAEAIKLKEQKVVSGCHLFAHFIGEASLEKYNSDVGKAFSSCAFGCSDGCFHGVMEQYMRNDADPYKVILETKNMCDSIDDDSELKFKCVHGVGHGLLAHNYLPLRDAIDACYTFDSYYWATSCIGGLAMENMDQYLMRDLDENSLRKIIPEICAPFEPEKSEIMDYCIYHVSLGLLYYTGYDIGRTEQLCEELPKQEHVGLCKKNIPTILESERPSIIKGF